MRRFILIAMACLGALALMSLARRPSTPLDGPVAEPGLPVGAMVAELELTGIDGDVHHLSDYRGKPLVIAMRDAGCPVSRRYGHETARIEREYGERGVAFVFVNANGSESDSTMRADAALFGLRGPYVPDPETKVAAAIGARSTTEVFVIDGGGVVRYRGGIDDQYGILFSRPEPTRRHLRLALDDVLAGRAVARESTFPEGCLLATGAAGDSRTTERGVVR